jgi:hypothetical protein
MYKKQSLFICSILDVPVFVVVSFSCLFEGIEFLFRECLIIASSLHEFFNGQEGGLVSLTMEDVLSVTL